MHVSLSFSCVYKGTSICIEFCITAEGHEMLRECRQGDDDKGARARSRSHLTSFVNARRSGINIGKDQYLVQAQ